MNMRSRTIRIIDSMTTTHSSWRRRLPLYGRSVAVASIAALAAFMSAGCNIVLPAMYIVQGPPKVDAQYKLDKSRVTVIFIDDRLNRAPRRSLRVVAADTAEQTLMQKGVLPEEKVITTRAAMRVAAQEEFDAPMTIAEMGRTVGAEVVVYATIDAWTLSPDGVTLSPGARVRVKIIDATNDVRLWPPDSGGYPVTAALPPQTAPLASNADRDQMNLALANALGTKIARLFFEHERDPLSGTIGD